MKNSMLHSLNLSSLYIGHSQYNPPKTKGMKHKKRPRPSWVYFIFFLCVRFRLSLTAINKMATSVRAP